MNYINQYGRYGPLPECVEVMPELPMPTEKELEKVNALFVPYVFYKTVRGGRELTTSCCGRDRAFYPGTQRTEALEQREFMASRHNAVVTCPFCGRKATLKAIGRKRGNLAEWAPVLFLRELDGDLLALGVWARKLYQDGTPADGPEYRITNAYRFTPGRAVQYEHASYGREDWTKRVLEGAYDPANLMIRDPFTIGGYMGGIFYTTYHVIGMEAVKRSAFRYCQYDMFWPRKPEKGFLMEYLAACCIWPRNIEMLMKCGMAELVGDLVEGRRKNHYLFKWGEEDPKKAFGLNGQEWRAFADRGYDLDTLYIYKKLRGARVKCSFGTAGGMKFSLGRVCADDLLRLCKKHGIDPVRAFRYLAKEPQCAKGSMQLGRRLELWKDYIGFCAGLGYDLHDETVALPRDFMRKHDEAAAAYTEREAEIKAAQYKRYEEKMGERAQKYDFALGDLFIRVARTYDEVVAEGNALKHCVGGYAGRHMKGKVTILLLRKASEPDVPFVTVEMDGNQLVQAHGYKNDAFSRPPREVYAEFFNTWLAWLKRGSPRNKTGAPRLRRKKGEHAA